MKINRGSAVFRFRRLTALFAPPAYLLTYLSILLQFNGLPISRRNHRLPPTGNAARLRSTALADQVVEYFNQRNLSINIANISKPAISDSLALCSASTAFFERGLIWIGFISNF